MPKLNPPELDLTQPILFDNLGPRKVVADFSGGNLSTDGGVLLLKQIDRGLGVSRMLAGCFSDSRQQVLVEHSLEDLLAQRIYGLALGYDDLNDHDQLRCDPLMAVGVGKEDPFGMDRLRPQHQGKALAGASTLNRMELSNNCVDRYHKLPHDPKAIEECLLKLAVRSLNKDAKEIVLDLDAMGHTLHGLQEGRYFNGYYDEYVYLPLYIVAGRVVLWTQLRSAEHDASFGVVDALKSVVQEVRRRLPGVRIMVRGDSGFCREELMGWCEGQEEVYYVLGLGKNPVLVERLRPSLADARARACLTGGHARVFQQFQYETEKTWSRKRRVVGKAEITPQGENPRFVVTSLPEEGFPEDSDSERFNSRRLYEEVYCERGNMENVLKQQVLDLNGDRMSTRYMASNQLRLWLSTFAYLLVERLQALTLQGTDLASATAGTIRIKVLKVAASVKVSVRRVYVQLSSAFPWQRYWRWCSQQLEQLNWVELKT
jgi:Transposase DDE domain group 1